MIWHLFEVAATVIGEWLDRHFVPCTPYCTNAAKRGLPAYRVVHQYYCEERRHVLPMCTSQPAGLGYRVHGRREWVKA